MAQYPCDRHGARYQGAQQTMYPAILDGADSLRKKLRLCPACFNELHAFTVGRMQYSGDADDGLIPCPICDGEPSIPCVSAFNTIYAKGTERADYFAVACHECKAELARKLGLT